MLARCPACEERFPVVGSGETACPFCGLTVSVRIERRVEAPQAAAQAAGQAGARAVPGFDTIAEPRTADKKSGGGGLWLPPPAVQPPPSGPPPLALLLRDPRRFFDRLDYGRPSVAPWLGGIAVVLGVAVQFLTAAVLLDRPLAGMARLGLAVGLGAGPFAWAVWRGALAVLSVEARSPRRLAAALGYGLLPTALAVVPGLGAPIGLVAALRAQARGLERHLGVPRLMAHSLVTSTWTVYAVLVAAAWP